MKYKTFRALVITGGIALFAGLLHMSDSGERERVPSAFQPADLPPQVAQAPAVPVDAAPVAPVVPAVPLPPGALAFRPLDPAILAAAAANIPGDKAKDAVRGGPWKVNLYRDAGHPTVNRLKVDYDRDEKWDEKWTFLPEGIKRQVAPNDDEAYTLESWCRQDLAAWTLEKPDAPGAPVPASPAAAPVPATAAAADALRPMDREILDAVKAFSGDKGKDAVRGRPWKVNLYRDAGHSTVNRLKIDLDRDEKWDEKWTFKPEGIEREVAPADDDVYTVRYLLPPGADTWRKP